LSSRLITLASYSELRDTGLPWIGQCPAHWDLRRMKYLFEERVEKGCPDEPLLTASQSRGVIPKSDYGGRTVEAQKDLHLLKLVRPGDYVISLRSFQGGIEYSHARGIISPAYTVLQPGPNVSRGYYEHYFKSNVFVASMSLFVTGIREGQNIDYVRLSRARMPMPPLEEQEAIGHFVRHFDQRVSRVIKAKKRLIELLNEQKQAIIHQAITRGPDSNRPMKGTGIEWLGDIPAHWKLKRFKFVTIITSGQVDPRVPPYRQMVLIAPNHIEKATGRLLGRETADDQGADSGKYLVRRGQVVYSKIRPNLQKATVAKEDSLCSADMYAIQPKASELSSEYLLLLMLSKPFTQYVVDCSMRVAMPKVNREALGNAWLWYPEHGEQQAILKYTISESAPFDRAIERTRTEIELVREYRSRLISDVVTGQLDVRHLDLPEIEESLIESIESAADEEIEETEQPEEVEA